MKIPKSLLRRAVKALREQAHMEAGTSQAPDLIKQEHTQAWADAKALSAYLREPGEPEVGIEDEPAPTRNTIQFTSNQLILLLQIYRGTLAREFKIGTYINDLDHLAAKKMIGPDSAQFDHGWTTTDAGNARVAEALQ